MKNKYWQIIKENLLIILLCLGSFLIRLPYLSNYLEDWDSVQFAVGLHNFSVVDHYPHPPGYTSYIFLGRVFNFFIQNDNLSLTLISAICGSFIIIPFYLLAKEFIDKKLVLILSLLLISFPLEWLLSEAALTNIPGLFFTTICAYFLYKSKQSSKMFYIGCLLSGLTMGVRFEFTILGSLILLVLLYRKGRGLIISALLFALGVSIWLVPTIMDTGLKDFQNAYAAHMEYIAEHDSKKITESISTRVNLIWELMVSGYTHFISLIFLIIGVGLITLKNKKFILRFHYIFIFVWFISYYIPLVFIYNLEITRYVLPLLVPIILTLGLVLTDSRIGKFLLVILIFIIPSLFSISLSRVTKFKNTVPPTIAPVLFVKENFSPSDTLLITSVTFRNFQYYAPEFENYLGRENAPKYTSKKFVIVDYLEFKNSIPYLKDYAVSLEKSFGSTKEIHPRVPHTNIFILKKK